MAEYYLVHVGVGKLNGAKIGSGRYPLGSGKRPYQGKQQGSTSAKKLSRREIRAQKRQLRKSKANKESVAENKHSHEFTDEDRQRIISTGNLREAYRNMEHLTNSDIDAVILRYNTEKKLKDLVEPKKKKGMDTVKRISNNFKTVGDLANNVVKAYNVSASISNAFFKTDWPHINTGGGGKSNKSKESSDSDD